jgi:hypothetical protein
MMTGEAVQSITLQGREGFVGLCSEGQFKFEGKLIQSYYFKDVYIEGLHFIPEED